MLLEDIPNLLANEMFGGGDYTRILPDLHAMGTQLRIQRCQRPLRKPSFHVENRFRPQCTHHRKQEPERGTALSAMQMAKLRQNLSNGTDADPLIRANVDRRTQGTQAIGSRRNVPGNSVAFHAAFSLTQGRTDQKPVGLGF